MSDLIGSIGFPNLSLCDHKTTVGNSENLAISIAVIVINHTADEQSIITTVATRPITSSSRLPLATTVEPTVATTRYHRPLVAVAIIYD